MKYNYYITPNDYELALKNGISNSTLTFRVRKYAWDIEKACTKPVKKKKIVSNEIRAILIKNNISLNAYKMRLTIGWSLERALNTTTMTRKETLVLATNKTRKKVI